MYRAVLRGESSHDHAKETAMTETELGPEKYISLTTFKKDGTPVSTPVWVVQDEGRLLVWTAASSWKVKRIRHNACVHVAPCSPTGKLRGAEVAARASIVEDTTQVQRLIARKYWFLYPLVHGASVASHKLRRKPEEPSVTIEISLN
jgi:PPOX class probable F420-dependent enzyme